jgi:hypothetical protein
LEAAILSSFAIFRGSALPSDELPALERTDGGLDHELSKVYELSGYYPAYVRQLTGLPDGRRYFVIPAFGRSEAVPPARCLPAKVRRELIAVQHRRLVELVDCIIETGGGWRTPPLGCEPFAAIDESGRVFQSSVFVGEPTVELVPDGVASVRIVYREAPPMVVPVSENAFLLTPPPRTARLEAELKRLYPRLVAKHLTKSQSVRVALQWDRTIDEANPIKIEWLNDSGGLVRTIRAPSFGSDSATSVGNLSAPIKVTFK